MKRFLLLVTILACVFSMSLAYGGGTSEAAATPRVELSLMTKEHPSQELSKSWDYWTWLEDATNVSINLIPVPESDYETKFNITVASGDLPDLIFSGQASATVYGLQGAIHGLKDLIDKYAPNTKQYLEQYDSFFLYADDGELYWWPRYNSPNLGSPYLPIIVYMYRTDWLKQLGMQEPTDLDGWYKVWKAVKARDPQSIPISNFAGNFFLFTYYAGAFGFNTHEDTLGWNWGLENGKIVNAMTHPNFREELAWFKKLYSEGLLDAEMFTRSKTQWEETTIAGKVFATHMTGNRALWFTEKARDAGDAGYRMEIARDPMGPYGQASYWGGPYRISEGLIMSANTKHPVEAAKFLEYLTGPEGTMLHEWGKEGVSYTIQNGGPVYTPEQQAMFDELGWHGGWHGPAYFASGPELTYYDTNGVLNDMEFYQNPMSRNMKDVKLVIPELKFTDAEIQQKQKINSDIGGFFNEWTTDFILGKRNLDTQWNEYVQKMNDLGAEKLTAIYNAAYSRYLAWKQTN